MTVESKEQIRGHSTAGIAGSNRAGGMDVYLLCFCATYR